MYSSNMEPMSLHEGAPVIATPATGAFAAGKAVTNLRGSPSFVETKLGVGNVKPVRSSASPMSVAVQKGNSAYMTPTEDVASPDAQQDIPDFMTQNTREYRRSNSTGRATPTLSKMDSRERISRQRTLELSPSAGQRPEDDELEDLDDLAAGPPAKKPRHEGGVTTQPALRPGSSREDVSEEKDALWWRLQGLQG